ncbi:MAG TPA: hypothetical protein VGC88_08540 [Terriglobales bacterium]|jgi:pimeloyl-ACP methyl ester carboxylesterase
MRKLILLLLSVSILTSAAWTQQIIKGNADNGAIFEIIVPANWNHQLVLYAHGIVDPQLPLSLPNDQLSLALLQALPAQGFAVAASSFSENGYAVKQGSRDTRHLGRIFERMVGKPAKTYLVGVSLGGLVVTDLTERFPTEYNGTLAMCGVEGGSQLEIEYVGNARVLFDFFFPGVLPGDLLHTPTLPYSPGTPTFNVVLATLTDGLDPSKHPTLPTLQLAEVLGLEAKTPTEIVSGLVQVIGFDVRFVNDVLRRTSHSNPFENAHFHYVGSLNDKQLNASVDRFHEGEKAFRYMLENYQTKGDLRVKLLSLHTQRDPLVPFFHESVYAGLVAAHHETKNLVQQNVKHFGHCAFNASEVFNAFAGLVNWVNTGVKPPSGDVTAPQ